MFIGKSYVSILRGLSAGLKKIQEWKQSPQWLMELNILNDLDTNFGLLKMHGQHQESFLDVPERIPARSRGTVIVSSPQDTHNFYINMPFEDISDMVTIGINHVRTDSFKITVGLKSAAIYELNPLVGTAQGEMQIDSKLDLWVHYVYDPTIRVTSPTDWPIQISLRLFKKRKMLPVDLPLHILSFFSNIPLSIDPESHELLQKEPENLNLEEWKLNVQFENVYTIQNLHSQKFLTVDPIQPIKTILAVYDPLNVVKQWWKIEPDVAFENIFSIKTFEDLHALTTHCAISENSVSLTLDMEFFANDCDRWKIQNTFTSISDFSQYIISIPFLIASPLYVTYRYSTGQVIQWNRSTYAAFTLREVVLLDGSKYYLLLHMDSAAVIEAVNSTAVKTAWPKKMNHLLNTSDTSAFIQYWSIEDVFRNGTLYQILKNVKFPQSYLSHGGQQTNGAVLNLDSRPLYQGLNEKLFQFSSPQGNTVKIVPGWKYTISRSIAIGSIMRIQNNIPIILDADETSEWEFIPYQFVGKKYWLYFILHVQTNRIMLTPTVSTLSTLPWPSNGPTDLNQSLNNCLWIVRSDLFLYDLFYTISNYKTGMYLRSPATSATDRSVLLNTNSETANNNAYDHRFFIKKVSS